MVGFDPCRKRDSGRPVSAGGRMMHNRGGSRKRDAGLAQGQFETLETRGVLADSPSEENRLGHEG